MYRDELMSKIDSTLMESVTYAVTLLGDSSVIVEGHRGIRSYSTSEVTIKVSKYYILVTGRDITIAEVNDRDLKLVGHIDKVVLHDET